MLVRTANGHNAELRFAASWPDTTTQWPRPWTGTLSTSGVAVTQDTAYGLPAVASVIRQPATLIASLPFITYRKGETRERAENTLPWQLLHDQPNPGETDTFRFFYDIALSLEASQNAFVQKARYRRQVKALIVLDPQRMLATRNEDGSKTYQYYADGERYDLDPADVVHIRGFTPYPGAMNGVSLIHQHRDAIGAAAAMQTFEGDYFRNNAQAPLYFTGAANQKHAQDLADLWNAGHAGTGSQWKPGFLWGAVDVKTVPLSLQDAMFVEAKRISIEDACRIWQWPHHLVELSKEAPVANEDAWTTLFMKIYMLWRLRRIERAFADDPDLYAGTDLYGEFLTDSLERADFSSRMSAYKNGIQGGVFTPNELREKENLPPVDGGDQIQFPLVGGGPVAPKPPTPDEPAAEPPRSLNGHGQLQLETLHRED